MPLSIQFTAKFETILHKREAPSYTFEVITQGGESKLMPLLECSQLIKTALELGFLSPKQETFWKDELQRRNLPRSNNFAGYAIEFCQKNVTFQLVNPDSYQKGVEVLIGLQKYDTSSQTLFFPGVITEVLSVRTVN